MTYKLINENIPWVEKYRPIEFNQIILDPYNQIILKNIITEGYFPNLLFYGPPGTGKTTTIINLIRAYQQACGLTYSSACTIHLNASDERGIDVIRSQIHGFVNTNNLFITGLKFVILDEIDYMTKNAQQALRYLMQGYNKNVRFCLICNYISKIESGLQNFFLKLQFNQLPKEIIVLFLKEIKIKEKMGNISMENLIAIQQYFKSDIRSMINFLQTNQDTVISINVINDKIWTEWYNTYIYNINLDYNVIILSLNQMSLLYNMDIKNLMKLFIHYLLRINPNIIL